MRAAPEVSCAVYPKKGAHEHTGAAENIRHSLRNGFTAYNALLCLQNLAECANGRSSQNRPSLDLSPSVLEGLESLSGSVGQVRCLPQPEQLHGRELDDGTE